MTALKKEVLSVGKHSLIYVVGQAISRGVGFFMIPIYTRYISPTNYGIMDMADILAGVLVMVISLNVADSMARFYYAVKDEYERRRIVSTVLLGFGTLAIPVVGLFVLFTDGLVRLIAEDPGVKFYLQIAFATAWSSMICEICYTYLRMRYMAGLFVSLTTIQLLSAVLLSIYLVVHRQLDILGVLYATLITQTVIGFGMAVTILWKVQARPSWKHFIDLLRFGLPLVPSRVTQQLGTYSNRFFLRWLGPADPALALAQVGIFSLGQKFGVVVNRFVNVPFNSFWKPRRMDLALREDAESNRIVARMCTYACWMTAFFALLLSAAAESVLRWIADAEYHAAHVIVPWIALAYVIHGLEPHFTTGMHLKCKTWWATAIALLALAVMCVCNFVLIPELGMIGAAIGTLVSICVRTTLFYMISQRIYPLPFEIGRIALILLAACLLYGFGQVIELPSLPATLAIRVALALCFPFLLLALGFFSEGELIWFQQTTRHGVSVAGRRCLRILKTS